MNQSYSEMITESVVDIFEKVAFLFPFPIEETEERCPDEDGQMICIGITFGMTRAIAPFGFSELFQARACLVLSVVLIYLSS